MNKSTIRLLSDDYIRPKKTKTDRVQDEESIQNYLNDYDEIVVIGSGKGVVSVNSIDKPYWKRKSLKYYRILLKIYQQAVTNWPRYNG